MWIFLAKLGSQMDFVTLLFVISNAAFLLIPLLKICPAFELPSDEGVIKEEDLIPEIPKKSTSTTSKGSSTSGSSSRPKQDLPPSHSTSMEDDLSLALHPVPVSENPSSARRMSPTLSTSLTEGMLTRSMAAAAATFVTSGLSSPSSVMSASAAVISSLVSQASSQLATSSATNPSPEREFMLQPSQLTNLTSSTGSGPDSLTPNVTAMPGHENDSDPEDEFLFDAKHFDKSSSSSSTSNSFEIINDI